MEERCGLSVSPLIWSVLYVAFCFQSPELTDVLSFHQLPPAAHFLDATQVEEAAALLKILAIFAFPAVQSSRLQGMHMLGPGEVTSTQMKNLIKVSREPFIFYLRHYSCPPTFVGS